MSTRLLGLFVLVSSALANNVHSRQNAGNTAVVDLSVNNGSPAHLASGAIYGVPNTPNQIPVSFLQDMGYNYGRSGGGQLSQGGWIMGMSAYQARFASAKENYQAARQVGGDFILLPHDLWGTDHANSSTAWPGDNGNWSDYDNFLSTVLPDLKSNNMLNGMVFDIWNEPDGGYFWKRNGTQYLEMWDRTVQKIRGDSSLSGMEITGPSTAGAPSSSNSWWVSFIENVVSSNTIPDWYSWHSEPGDPNTDIPNLNSLLASHNAPQRPININEYATYAQQVPAGSAWFISRLERWNAHGLRGNWLNSCQLYDFLASLLTKTEIDDCSGTGYQMNGDYTTYKYYNMNMTGYRTKTTSSGDGKLDAYTTVASNTVRTLVGVINSQVGTWYLTLENLSSVGLPQSGSLAIQTWAFEDTGHFGDSSGPSSRGVATHSYTANKVTFPIYNTAADNNTAFAFEFSR